MSKAKKMIESLLSQAGITINGNDQYDILVHNESLYERVLQNPALALGESYMDGWWDSPALDQFFDHLLRAELEQKVTGNLGAVLLILKTHIFNRQNKHRAFQVGRQHYDVGNDLYKKMLDKRLVYTCGYWKEAKNLDEAQEAKLDLICRKLQLEPGMKVLDLGCGWGSFAKFASEKYDVQVTGYTVSKEQVALGKELCKGLPVELHLADYRTVQGQYDRVLSIGIMEHVGYKNYRTYMEVTDRCLKADGLAFIHTIGHNDSTTKVNDWTDKYIFPNGMIPSIAQLGTAMENIFIMEDWHNFGPDYDKTLMAWHANFESAWPDLKDKYGERFHRMWRYYLLSSAAGFRARQTQLWHIVLNRLGRPIPDSRLV